MRRLLMDAAMSGFLGGVAGLYAYTLWVEYIL